MRLRNLMVLAIMVFVVSVLVTAEETKVEWEYIKGGQGIAIVQGAIFDEVWERIQDVLFFEKFKIPTQPIKVRHKIDTTEKAEGLLVVNGWIGSTFSYVLNISIRDKGDHIEVNCRCSSSWRKKVIQRFFQLLEEGLTEEE